jgi:hypothetical protein
MILVFAELREKNLYRDNTGFIDLMSEIIV